MVALFLGAFYRLGRARRWWLLGAGPALAAAFNFTRTLVLVFVAARAGLPAMERWRDPTGVALLVGCFLGLWGVAAWLARKSKKQKTENRKQKAETPDAGGRESEIRSQTADIEISSAFQGFKISVFALAATHDHGHAREQENPDCPVALYQHLNSLLGPNNYSDVLFYSNCGKQSQT